jgi:hypothetical protein
MIFLGSMAFIGRFDIETTLEASYICEIFEEEG